MTLLLLPPPRVTALLPATVPLRRNVVVVSDALALLRSLPDASVDAVITDPPYGLAGRVFEFPHKLYSAVNEVWDHHAPIDWMAECQRILRPGGSVACFGGRESIYAFAAEGLRLGWRLINDITWFKSDAAPNFTGRMMTESTERILWFCPDGERWTYDRLFAKQHNNGKNYRDLWEFGTTRGERLHPTQKPLALMNRLVGLITRPGDLVIDPFCGSGTTLLAAKQLGREYIGGDITPDYVTAARTRLNPSMPLFAEPTLAPVAARAVPLFAMEGVT